MSEKPTESSGRRVRPWWRLRWYEVVPEVAVVLGLTIFLIDQTDAATSAFESGRAVTLMVVTTIGWLLTRGVLARLVRWPLIRTAVFGVGALGILAVVVLPAYDNDTVIETFPVAEAEPSPTTPPDSTPDTTTVPVTAPTIPAQVRTDPAPDASPPTRPSTPPAAAAASDPPPSPTTTVAAAPARFRVGSFRGVDHRASETVAFYRQLDGSYVIGLEDFDIQPGPDYDVYVVPGEEREDREGGTRIDDLRGNRGTQYYDVPPGIDLTDGPWTVLVWCQTFAVPVATATPA